MHASEQHALAQWEVILTTLSFSLSAQDGRTALHAAALNGRTRTVEALLVKGAEADAKDNSVRNSPSLYPRPLSPYPCPAPPLPLPYPPHLLPPEPLSSLILLLSGCCAGTDSTDAGGRQWPAGCG